MDRRDYDVVQQEHINPHEAAAGFATLAVIIAGELLLIVGATHHDVPLSPLAQIVSRLFGA